MKKVFLNLSVCGYVSAAVLAALSLFIHSTFASDTVKIQTFQAHSRVFFSLDPSVNAQLKNTDQGFEVEFKGISLSDLGAPLGEEKAWANQFSQTSDPRIARIQFAETTNGVKVIGTWKFPMGKQALVNPKMETFDFRQSSPSGYVIDFWLKKGAMTRAEYIVHEKEQARLAVIRKNEDAKKQKAERRIASEQRLNEIEDTTRFCSEPLSEKKDIFLQFYAVHPKIDFKKWFPTTTADANLPYDEPTASAEDAQYVRVALKLYREGKVALVLKTLDFFEAEHPKSQYRVQMQFLRANAMLKLGLKTEAEAKLKNLMSDAKDNPVALHAAMYIAYQQMERGDTMGATETFLWLSTHFGDSSNAWVFHMGTAECLFKLNQVDRALKEYEWVVEKGTDANTKAEGALRIADLYMQRFQYDQALAGYYQGLHYFPEQAKKCAPLHINRAEALYGLGEWDRAKEAFEAFLKDFPGSPYGWRATYRLGEIEGRKTGPKIEDSQKLSREWFYATVNGYPFSPGATLARLRLLPCGDHGGFDEKASNRFFGEDLKNFNPVEEVQMVPFRAFKVLTQVRSMIAFHQESAAVDLATEELQKPGNIELHDILSSTLGGVFRKTILKLLAENRQYEALTYYKAKATFLPKTPSSPEETDYLLKLSQAASDLGLGDLAKEIADSYAKLNSARGVAGVGSTDLTSELTASEQHFTQAKALWVASGMKEEKSVRAHLMQVREESPFSYQKELILGLIEQKSGKQSAALAHAIRAQMLKPADVQAGAAADLRSDLRVDAWIADIQAQEGDAAALQVALDMEKNLERHVRLQTASKTPIKNDDVAAALGIPPMPTLDLILLSEGRMQEKQGRWGDAAATYARAVDDKIGGNQALYQYARTLARTGKPGDRVKARAVLEKLASGEKSESRQPGSEAPVAANTDDFWKKLAREALSDENTMEGGNQ
jgi:tetratricopeptide (TPR) repeat protein